MISIVASNLSNMKIGFILVVISLAFGLLLGVFFGIMEDEFKGHIKVESEKVFDSVYKGDEAKMKKIQKKSWTYIKRAHFHSNGMATMALILVMAMAVLPLNRNASNLASIFLGIGALGYPASWLIAGWNAPALGSTGTAKTGLSLFVYPVVGLYMIGFLIFCFMTIQLALKKDKE